MNRDGAASLDGVVNGDDLRSLLLLPTQARRERGSCARVSDALKNPQWVELMRNPDVRLGQEGSGERRRLIGKMAMSCADAIIGFFAVNHDTKVTRHLASRFGSAHSWWMCRITLGGRNSCLLRSAAASDEVLVLR